MPKDGYVSITWNEKKWNHLKYIAKLRKYKTVQQMIHKNYLGDSK